VGGASEDEKTRGTKEAVIEYIFKEMNIENREDVIMIGDRHYDINGAKEFSIDSLGVLYGFGTREELEKAGATYIAEDTEAIKKILL
jgi:phosphoglycolate phosphatase